MKQHFKEYGFSYLAFLILIVLAKKIKVYYQPYNPENNTADLENYSWFQHHSPDWE